MKGKEKESLQLGKVHGEQDEHGAEDGEAYKKIKVCTKVYNEVCYKDKVKRGWWSCAFPFT